MSLPDGAAVEIPAGALSANTIIAVRVVEATPSLPEGFRARGKAYAFEPHGTIFRKPVTLRLPFGGTADGVSALRLDDTKDTSWEPVSGGQPAGHALALSVLHFSIYRVVAASVAVPDAAILDATVPDAMTPDAAAPDDAAFMDAARDDVDECAAGAVVVCGEGALDCTDLVNDHACTCDVSHIGTGTRHCETPIPCAPVIASPGETCYELRAHGVSSTTDTTKAAVPAGESISFFYFDVPWAAGSLGSRMRFLSDNASVTAEAWLFDTGNSPSGGTVTSNVVGTVTGENAALLDFWGPGGCDLGAPADVGLHLPSPGRRLLVSVHYVNATAQAQLDGSGFEVCTVEAGSRAHIAGLTILGTESFTGPTGMPAGVSSYEGTCTNDSGSAITILSLTAHAHRLATRMQLDVTRAAGGTSAVWDQPYDFNAQVHHELESPLTLAAGDSVSARCTFDNQTGSPVPYGLKLDQEQCYLFTLAYPYLALDNGVLSLFGPNNTCW